jgi:hypothetical protein
MIYTLADYVYFGAWVPSFEHVKLSRSVYVYYESRRWSAVFAWGDCCVMAGLCRTVCMYVYMYVCIYVYTRILCVYVYACMSTCMYVCRFVYVVQRGGECIRSHGCVYVHIHSIFGHFITT